MYNNTVYRKINFEFSENNMYRKMPSYVNDENIYRHNTFASFFFINACPSKMPAGAKNTRGKCLIIKPIYWFLISLLYQ